MTDSHPENADGSLPLSIEQQLDGVCDRFEAAWQLGARPSIAEYLGGIRDESHGRALFRALLEIDIAYLARDGKTARAQDYSDFAHQFGEIIQSSLADAGGEATREGAWGSSDETMEYTVEDPPDVRNRYRLNQLHATGGLGRVWVARDPAVGRDVALKELRPDRRSIEDVERRFVAEARVTGQLEHPNIVPVYEVSDGAPDERPYYTMRLVRGHTLRQAILQYHESTRKSSKDLEFRHLLGALLGVMNAVTYAHSRGVIHRDLKGQNVVLGDFGEVVVLDWGLAKSVGRDSESAVDAEPAGGDALVTADGQLVGTPAYMSPEQASGRHAQVDVRSDIYCLGGLLYEILTGHPPFEGSGTESVLDRARRGSPTPPRKVHLGVPRALEAICLQALEKDPDQRYQSASLMAEDLRRWLGDEPVSAYREPFIARCSRWSRKNRSIVAAAVIVLCVALVASTVNVVSISRAQVRTDRARARAEANFQRARDAVDRMLTQVADERLRDLPQMEYLRQSLLEQALEFHQQFLEEQGNDPNVRREAAHSYRRLGDIYSLLGRIDEAESSFEQSIRYFEQLAERTGEPADALEAAESHRRLATVYGTRNLTDQATASIERSHEILERLADRDSNDVVIAGMATGRFLLAGNLNLAGKTALAEKAYRESLDLYERLSSAGRKHLEYQAGMAASLHALGGLLESESQLDQAEEAYRRALDIRKAIVSLDDRSMEYRHQLGSSYITLSGLLYRHANRQTESEELLQAALAARRRLASDSPHVPAFQVKLAESLNDLAIRHAQQNEMAEADRLFVECLNVYQTLSESLPKVPDYRLRFSRATNNLGVHRGYLFKSDDAIRMFEQTVNLRQRLVDDHPDVPEYRAQLSDAMKNLGSTLRTQRRFQEAVPHLERAIQLREQLGRNAPLDRHRLAQLYRDLAQVLPESQVERKRRAFGQAIDLSESAVSDSPTEPQYRRHLAMHFEEFAGWQVRRGEVSMAVSLLASALRIGDQLVSEFPTRSAFAIESARICRRLGAAMAKNGQDDEAEATLKEAIDRHERCARTFPEAAERVATQIALIQLEQCRLTMRSPDAATDRLAEMNSLCRQALVTLQHDLDHGDPSSLEPARNMAEGEHTVSKITWITGRRVEAIEMMTRAANRFRDLAARHADDTFYKQRTAESLQLLGEWMSPDDPTTATACLREAIQLLSAAAGLEPDDPEFALDRRSSYAALVELLAGQRAFSQALSACRQLGRHDDSGWENRVAAAALAATLVTRVASDTEISVDARQELRQQVIDAAFVLLEDAYDAGCRDAMGLESDTRFDPVRGEPAFARLLERMRM